jgi:hypothetical protein
VRDRLGRALDALAVALLGFYMALAVPWSLLRGGDELAQAVRSHESREAARVRVRGAAFTRGIDDIRRRLPPDQAYLLVEAGSRMAGGAYWVRYELAPRRALFLGHYIQLTNPKRVRRQLATNLHQVVISYGPDLPPRLLPRYVFMHEIELRRRAARAPGLPSAPVAPSAPGTPSALVTRPSGRPADDP